MSVKRVEISENKVVIHIHDRKPWGELDDHKTLCFTLEEIKNLSKTTFEDCKKWENAGLQGAENRSIEIKELPNGRKIVFFISEWREKSMGPPDETTRGPEVLIEKIEEKVWVDFLCIGTIQDYATIIDKLENALNSFSNSFEKGSGKFTVLSSRGRLMKIGGNEFYHGNTTLIFIYYSEYILEISFEKDILPKLFEICLSPILNSGNCTIIENLYPGDYFSVMAKVTAETNEAICKRVKELRPDIPESFVRGIINAQRSDSPKLNQL